MTDQETIDGLILALARATGQSEAAVRVSWNLVMEAYETP